MTHRAESILAAVKTAVTNLTTTGTRVVRGRVFAVGTLPALSVDMGSELPVDESNMAFQDELLEVAITSYVKGTQGTTDTEHNTIAAEVYAALMADRTLGLGYVHTTRWLGRLAPRRDNAEQAVSQQEMRIEVHYRHSHTSAEA